MTIESTETELQAQVKWLVRMQDAMDDGLFMPGIRRLIPMHLTTHNQQSICGATFALNVLPFLTWDESCEYPGLAPVAQVLGASWKWRKPYKNSSEELLQFFTDERRSSLKDEEVARLFRIDPLGLFVAHEGKNRVRFLRDAGVETMPASITPVTYPSPGRIRLYRVEVLGRGETWAVLDDRFLTPLGMPEISIPILTAYGVETPVRWPDPWPMPADVAAALNRRADQERRSIVDLEPLRQAKSAADQDEMVVPASLSDFVVIQPGWKRIALTAAAWLLLTVLASLIPNPVGTPVLAFLSGAGLCAALLGYAKLFRAKRLYLR